MIATYNERQPLPQLVQQIWQHLPLARILVVDDNSPDGTGDWVRELAARDERIELLHREEKAGLGAATVAGLQMALQKSSDWIATMDADLSHRPEDLNRMWQVLNQKESGDGDGKFDVLIGSRYIQGGRIENWSLPRRFASRAVNGFARWVLWLKTRDNSGAFRIYRSETLRRTGLDSISCNGFAYLEQILMHLKKSGARFHEVPIVFSERNLGESKVTLGELFRNLRDILWLGLRRG